MREPVRPVGRIGTSLEEARRELVVAGGLLRKILEPAGVTLIEEVEKRLETLTCKIALIGQIKAGKTSAINALVGQPGLLPTDVNPSTSAITQLHFNQSSSSGEAAVFHFFSQEEWQSLASGTGRLRNLTETLVPGFEPARLHRSVAAVRSRAASRLGTEYARLLGKSHTYSKVNPNILLGYVCASETAPQGSDIGLYSEITKSADLYISEGPFDFPVTIIDTPGTNDPFLIRDEITRSCLDKADAYVVVLSALQPLSEADVSLLRILRGLQRDRIVILLNRIDELDDKRDVANVIEFVRNNMAIEFPDCDIPIIAGSARLMAASTQHSNGNGSSQPQSDSGIVELKILLNNLLSTTSCAYLLRKVALCYTYLAKVSGAVARDQLGRLSSKDRCEPAGISPDAPESRKAQFDQETLVAAQNVIQRSALDLEVRLRSMLKADLGVQRERLTELVTKFAANERCLLIEALSSEQDLRTWTCHVAGLRKALRSEFLEGFERSKGSLAAYASSVSVDLRRLIEKFILGATIPDGPNSEREAVPNPNALALGQSLLFDLDSFLWWQFWRTKPTHEERGAELERLINDEFSLVIEDLLASHHRVLDDYIDTTTRWLLAACHNVLQMLQRQREWIDASRKPTNPGNSGEKSAQVDSEMLGGVNDLEFRQATAEDALKCLSAVHKYIDRSSGGEKSSLAH